MSRDFGAGSAQAWRSPAGLPSGGFLQSPSDSHFYHLFYYDDKLTSQSLQKEAVYYRDNNLDTQAV
jgi:hypothetical protein